ncbi:hypothetical protein V470_11040 [Streptococcus sp. VT 162]|nr:hypothetical protein V470_11040 [Streptococcus sp. VT 162]
MFSHYINKALETALEQINKLKAAQPEKPAQPEQPEEPSKPDQPAEPKQPEIEYDKAMNSLAKAIEKKVAELGSNLLHPTKVPLQVSNFSVPPR